MGERSYRFAPHPSAGFLLGLRVPQLLGFILAVIVAIVLVALWSRMVGGRPTATNRI